MKHKLWKKRIAFFLVIAMMLSFMPQTWAGTEDAAAGTGSSATGEVSSPSALQWSDDTVAVMNNTTYSSLQLAIAAATNGDVIELIADAPVSEKITLSGKAITITADSEHKITGNSSLATLIEVSEDAALTLSGSVVVDGTGMKKSKVGYHKPESNWYYLYNGTGMLDIHGTLTVQDDVSIQNYTIGEMAGAVNVSGNSAIFNLQGGKIQNNTSNYQGENSDFAFCAPVRVGAKATVNMSGGSIENNYISYEVHNDDGKVTNWSSDYANYSSSGIFVSYSGTVNMTGGSIQDNMAFRGSAIHVYGQGTVNISDSANIFNNSCGEYTSLTAPYIEDYRAAGAVFIEAGGTLNMAGGTISNNKGGSGGGVALVSAWEKGIESVQTKYNMTGGSISNNIAIVGGGIYSYSNGVNITSGNIINNTATSLGGGIYSEGNSTNYSTVHLKNVVVYDNIAACEGGGLWTCPTGNAVIYVTEGGAIYNNSANFTGSDFTAAAGDDIASGSANDYSMTLATRILGGGIIQYYRDGGLQVGSPYPVVDTTVERYDVKNTDAEPIESVRDLSGCFALKSQAEGIALAESLAQSSGVVISGNKASYGGGIGANGGVEIGTDSVLKEISVEKQWDDDNNSAEVRPDSVTVYLKNGETIIETVKLNAQNEWRYTFKDLPRDGTYTVTEEEIKGYSPVVTGDEEKGFVITNKYNPTGALKVSKTVSGSGASKDKLFTFTVTLDDKTLNGDYGDVTFKDGVAIFTLKHGESKKATGLPADITYSVVESDNSGYTVTATDDTGTIAADQTATAAFTNYKGSSGGGGGGSDTPQTGSLEVRKIVSGSGGDREKAFIFTVTLDDNTISGQYGDMTFHKGVATVMLKHGESKQATGLLKDVGYEVTESGNSGYTVTVSGEKGVLVQGETAHVLFENHKDTTPGEEPDEPSTDYPNVPDESSSDNPPDAGDSEDIENNKPPTGSMDTDVPTTEVPLGEAPKTGDTAPILLLSGVLVAAACGVVLSRRKRNQ